MFALPKHYKENRNEFDTHTHIRNQKEISNKEHNFF